MKRCDIVIISCNQFEYTIGCVDSIENNTNYPNRVIIVDNASDEVTRTALETLSRQGRIILIQNKENEGWVCAVNKGIAYSDADFVCVMNNDTVVYPGWLDEMIRVAESDSRIGLVNPEWELPKRYSSGRDAYFRDVISRNSGSYSETDWIRGFCFLITRVLIQKIGGLDVAYSPGYYDDGDYSVRALQAGFIVVRARGAFVWHFRNITARSVLGNERMNSLLEKNKRLFHQRWGHHLRILFIVEPGLDKTAFHELIRVLLREQHKIRIITVPGLLTKISHDNLLEFSVPRWLLQIAGCVATVFNARHHDKKKFNIIVCSERTEKVLSRTWVIRDFYRFLRLESGGDFSKLMADLSLLKHNEKAGNS